MERDPWVRTLIVLLVIAVAFHVLGVLWDLASRFADIGLLFFLAWLLAFLLNSLAGLLGRAGVGRRLAVAVIYLGLIVLLAVGAVLVVPVIAVQLYQLGQTIPDYVGQAPALIEQAQAWLLERGVRVNLESFYEPAALAQRAEAIGTAVAQNALGIAQGIATAIFKVVIILMLSFYFMIDGQRVLDRIVSLLPERYHADAHFFFGSIDRTFGGFVRGMLLQAIAYGAGTAIVMAVAQLPFVAAISAFAAVVMLIPFVGPIIAIIPPLVVAYFTAPFGTFLAVFVALFLLQQVMFNVIAPKLMSEAVGIHPLLVFGALLVGSQVAGFWGALFGVPVAGVLYAMFNFFLDRVPRGPPAAAVPPRAEREPARWGPRLARLKLDRLTGKKR